MSRKKIFLTGITGFLGSNLAHELLNAGFELVCLVRALNEIASRERVEQTLRVINPKFEINGQLQIIEGDVQLPCLGLSDSIIQMLRQEVDSVFHCAGSISFSEQESEKTWRTNVEGVRQIIDFNPIFKKFSERLMAIKDGFDKNQIDLTERIKQYCELLNDVKEAQKESQELGYDLKERGLYYISKEYIKNQDKELIRGFIKEMRNRLDDILDANWQESSKREHFIKEVKKSLQELILKDYKNKIKINNFPKYLNRLMDVIIKSYKYEETNKTS